MLNKKTKTLKNTVVKTKLEYAENGVVIREENMGNSPNVHEGSFDDVIKEAYGNIINNEIQALAKELKDVNYVGFDVKIEIKPILKNKDLFFKE